MIRTIFIFDTGEVADSRTLLGLLPAERAMLAAWRAGFTRFVLVTADALVSKLAARLLASDALQRKGIVPEIMHPGRNPGKVEGHSLVLTSATILTPQAWATLPVPVRGADLVLVNRNNQIIPWPELKAVRPVAGADSARPVFAGGWMVGAPGLAALLAAFTAGPCLAALLDALPHVDHAAPAEGAGLVVHDGRSRELARRRLLHAMRKPTDGFVARHLNRYVSLFLTRFLILVRLTPNTVSFGNLGLGIGAAILAGLGDYTATLIGALLFQLTSIIDGCDGEVAKLTFRDSSKGAWIDTFCDQAGYLVFFIGLPIGLSRAAEPALGLAGGVYLALGGLTLAVIPLLFLVMHRYVRRAGAGGSMLKILEDVQAAAALPGWRGRLNALVFRLSFVFRRDFFAAGALVLCAAGLSWLLMFMIAGSCLGMLLYLLYFSRGGVRA